MVIYAKNFTLNSVFVENDIFIKNKCPYKNGDKILFYNSYYKIIITTTKNKSKLFHKLKMYIPELWHQYIDFIVNK